MDQLSRPQPGLSPLGYTEQAPAKQRFPAKLRGEDKPADNAERLAFAQFAYDQKKFAFATRLWAKALASDPKLGDDRQTQHRYNAARAAALAVAGQGQDKPPLDDAAKAKLGAQAHDWLKAELAIWNKLLLSGMPLDHPFVVQTLSRWRQDTDLAGLRDVASLARLPEAEQKQWQTLWAEVDTTVNKHWETAIAEYSKLITDESTDAGLFAKRAVGVLCSRTMGSGQSRLGAGD